MPGNATRRESARALIVRVAGNVLGQLRAMRGELGPSARGLDFANIEQSVISCLCRIETLLADHVIDPRLDSRPLVPRRRALRLGIFPTAANPFHWAHLVGGLSVMERFSLDKVIFIVAGHDPRKPGLASEEQRHAMARSVLALFDPLFAYSPIALGTDRCGEENLFLLLDSFRRRPVHAFYIAGSDHYRRWRPGSDVPDTIGMLEQGLMRHAPGRSGLHRVSAVFLQRGMTREVVPTWLDVKWVGSLPVETSSTEIRAALADARRRSTLSTLPFVALKSIRVNNLYDVDLCDITPAPPE